MARPKILLVDDTRLILELEKSFLKFSDVDILTAGNGIEALEVIRKEAPDLVFMDLNMPGMDGISCCATLKADPFLSEVPVVMLTTAGREDDRERAAKAGCNDFLTKPIDRHEFLEMARKYTDAVDRREPRLACQIPVVFLMSGTPAGGHALDISEGGLFVATHQAGHFDAAVRLAFYLPGVKGLLEVTGRIAWVNNEWKRVKPCLPAGFGMEFLNLDEAGIAALKAYLAASAPGVASSDLGIAQV